MLHVNIFAVSHSYPILVLFLASLIAKNDKITEFFGWWLLPKIFFDSYILFSVCQTKIAVLPKRI